MSQLQDKVALVTGGGTGIGKAIAEEMIARGARVVVTGRREEPLAALAEKFPGKARYITADVAKPGDPKRAVAFALEQMGRLDTLVNNAGVYISKPLIDTTDEDIAHVFGVNIAGLLAMTREAIPALAKSQGSVINISSTVANAALAGHAVYSGTKAAMNHITRTLAAELGPQKIRVNAISPGLTVTDAIAGLGEEQRGVMVAMTPLGRLGMPEDMGPAAAFLASDDAAWITGQVLAASGGLML